MKMMNKRIFVRAHAMRLMKQEMLVDEGRREERKRCVVFENRMRWLYVEGVEI